MSDYIDKTSLDDATLVALAREGDRSAIECLFVRYMPVIEASLAGRLPRVDKDDLVQDVLVGALVNLGRLRDSARVGPWFMSIARHKLHGYYKARKREGQAKVELERVADEELVLWAPGPDAQAAMNQLAEATLAALGELKERYRVVLYLRLFKGLSYSDIGARLGVRDGTIRIRAKRGLQSLRCKLVARGFTPPEPEAQI